MRFIIVSPRTHGGGSIVLHTLCRKLNGLGYDAKIVYVEHFRYNGNKFNWWIDYILFTISDVILETLANIFPDKLRSIQKFSCYFDQAISGCKRKVIPIVGEDSAITVYPEAISGNPLKGKNVVRWFLSYNKYPNDPEAYGEKDLYLIYREIFNDNKLRHNTNLLCLTYFDLELYKRYNYGNRQGKCYIIRKGASRVDLPSSFDGIIIDGFSEKKKVEIFNKCEYCISYDTQTAYSQIAAMCGCISIVIPEHGKDRHDYITKEEEAYGVAYDTSKLEIEYAISTREKIIEHFRVLNAQSDMEVMKFVELCEKYFTLSGE